MSDWTIRSATENDNPAAIGFWQSAGNERQQHRARFVRHAEEIRGGA